MEHQVRIDAPEDHPLPIEILELQRLIDSCPAPHRAILSAASRNIAYVPVLSEATPACNWSGRTGLVHSAALADLPDLSGFDAYVCGAPAMVDAARRDFTAAGLPDDRFFADAFTVAAN